MKVGIASTMVGFVALVSCGGRDEAATSAALTSLPATTVAPTTTMAETVSTTMSDLAANEPRPRTPVATNGPQVDSVEGFTVDYPGGWGPAGRLQATAFANGATCGSAAIVDRAGPDDSGPGASIEQSFVQICWRPLDGTPLPEGMMPATLAGRPAVVARAGISSTYFVDTSTRRYQVVTAVVAPAELEPARLAEVGHILESLSLPD